MHIEAKGVKGPNAENLATTGLAAKSVKGDNFETLMHRMDKTNDSEVAAKAKQSVDLPVLKFSNHAVERMSARGIHFTAHEVTEMEQAAKKASAKGSKDALFITKDAAAIVSLKNNTVVTVLNRDALKNNVFTNIDATVFI